MGGGVGIGEEEIAEGIGFESEARAEVSLPVHLPVGGGGPAEAASWLFEAEGAKEGDAQEGGKLAWGVKEAEGAAQTALGGKAPLSGGLRPEGCACLERPELPVALMGEQAEGLPLDAFEAMAGAFEGEVEAKGGIEEGLHAAIGAVLFATAMLGEHL